jgi:hypothetical protein
MPAKEVKSLVDYIKETETIDPFSDLILFRGQGIRGNLLPGIARKSPKTDSTKIEK